MSLMKWTLTVAALSTAAAISLSAQDVPAANPLAGNADAIRFGTGLFRARCADCHGMDARGVRSPDLTQVWASGRTDDGLFKTIKNGVPGTEMPAVGARMFDNEIWQILAYLRTLAAPAPTDAPKGNAENGQRVFRANCAGCHRVNGTGGRLGPDLSRVGVARTRDMMVKQIRGATEDFRPGYEPVTVTSSDGQAIHGVKKNEDNFSVQIMDTRERIQGYEKDKMKSVADDTKSAMPTYGPDRLNESDLDDVIRYLQTLRGFDPAVKPVDRRLYAHNDRTSRSRRLADRSARRRRGRAAGAAAAQVAIQEIADGLKPDGSRWLTFGGNYANHRFSPLTQITPDNVAKLQPQWTFQTATLGNFETTTLVRDNMLYVTGPQNLAWARRRADRQANLALPPGAAARTHGLLRARQSRVRRPRRQAVHDHARRAPDRARHEDRRGRVGRHDGGIQEGIRLDALSARRPRQGDRRRGRRRVRHPRIHRRLRRADRQARLALLHDSRSR